MRHSESDGARLLYRGAAVAGAGAVCATIVCRELGPAGDAEPDLDRVEGAGRPDSKAPTRRVSIALSGQIYPAARRISQRCGGARTTAASRNMTPLWKFNGSTRKQLTEAAISGRSSAAATGILVPGRLWRPGHGRHDRWRPGMPGRTGSRIWASAWACRSRWSSLPRHVSRLDGREFVGVRPGRRPTPVHRSDAGPGRRDRQGRNDAAGAVPVYAGRRQPGPGAVRHRPDRRAAPPPV